MAHEPSILRSTGSNASAGIRVLHVISVGVISLTRLILIVSAGAGQFVRAGLSERTHLSWRKIPFWTCMD